MKTQGKFHDIKFDNDVLVMMPKTQATKKNFDIFGHIKIKLCIKGQN